MVSVFPNWSVAATVTVNGTLTVAAPGAPTTRWSAAAGSTVTPDDVPGVDEPSETLTVWDPAVSKVTPLVKV